MGRVAFITGGTRGIGFAVAEALLAAGDTVAITGTATEGVEQASSRWRQLGDVNRVLGLVCDVREAPAVESAMHDVVARFGGLDVLVNNAGVGVGAPIADLSHDEWHRIIDTNVTGVFHCCKAAIPHLRARGGGWIISISSLASKNPFAGGAAYCASKAGAQRVQRGADAGGPLRQHPRELRAAGIGGDRVLGPARPRRAPTGSCSRRMWREAMLDLLAHQARSLPSRVEIRPSRPQKS